MLARRACLRLLWLGLATCGAGFLSSSFSLADPSDQGGAQIETDLKTILEKGLRCRLPEEFAYVGLVVAKVEAGQIPSDLVRSTFAWARKKPKYQIRFFDQALRHRAAELGIEVPRLQNPNE